MKDKMALLLMSVLTIAKCLNAQPALADRLYANENPIRTVITGSSKIPVMKFYVSDYSSCINEMDRAEIQDSLEGGFFKFELFIKNPVYLVPATRGAGALAPGSVFNGILSTRYVSNGILIEPGDSINIEEARGITTKKIGTYEIAQGVFDEIPFFDEQKFSGRGAEKLWCIQAIIRNSKLFDYPSNPKEFNDIFSFSDSVTSMILKTIDIFKQKMSPAAISIIKGHYIPMLAYDISDILLGAAGTQFGEVDIHNQAVKNLYVKKLAAAGTIFNPKDPYLGYGSFFSGTLRKRAFLQYAMAQKVDYNEAYRSYTLESFKALVKYIPESPIKTRAIAEYVARGLARSGLNGQAEEVVQAFLNYTKPGNNYRKIIQKYYRELQTSLGKGGPTYLFELPDTAGRIVKMSDLKDKVIVMDFFYYACPGCIQLTPYLTKVQKEFDDNPDVVFVSVSIDTDKKKWLSGIGKASILNSIHLNARDNINDPLIKFYNVNSYPQIVVIDKKAKLITSKAPDPRFDNGEALIKIINQGLSEY